jgi:hypothetical protein
MTDAGMPMPALVFWMPMPTYVIYQHYRYTIEYCAPQSSVSLFNAVPGKIFDAAPTVPAPALQHD